MRCDSGIASIYDEAGLEMENAELLFTPEGACMIIKCSTSSRFLCAVCLCVCIGAYMFKAYSNGHPYDTSQVSIITM